MSESNAGSEFPSDASGAVVTEADPSARRPRVRRALPPVLVVALAGNLLVWVAARLLGADFQVDIGAGGPPVSVGPLSVFLMTTVPLLLAGAALALLRLWAPTSWRGLAWVGLVVGVLTMPIFLDADGATRAGLSLMHLLTGAAWFWGVRRELAAGRAAV